MPLFLSWYASVWVGMMQLSIKRGSVEKMLLFLFFFLMFWKHVQVSNEFQQYISKSEVS